jgi:hypothetical protein
MSTEQHVSAQVWTCTRCGGEDPKSCGCSAATATSREIQAAKREQARQRKIRQRKKDNENNDRVTRDATVENIETLMPRPEDEAYFQDDDEGNYTYTPTDDRNDAACRVRGFIFRAQRSVFAAEADSLKNLVCTKEMLEAADAVIEAWTKLRKQMRE